MKFFRYCVLLLSLVSLISNSTKSQDSSRLRISLLTCSPGSELYAVFGHNALRIVDSTVGTDIVYNYGTFDFDDPDFYTKFVRGKLMYFLSQQSFENFKYEYAYFRRGIVEQVLSFDAHEKKKIQQKLFDNMLEENRYYKYDFLKDNCTTRLRDIIFSSSSVRIDSTQLAYPISSSYRDYLHTYLDRAKMPWTALGIDILLGVRADFRMSLFESMFLPDFLMNQVGKLKIGRRNLVSEELVLLEDLQPQPQVFPFIGMPLFVFFFFSAMCLLLGFFSNERMNRFQPVFDRLLFLIVGLLGCLLTFLWFGTDHQSFAYNINLVWAFPFNMVMSFFLGKNIYGSSTYLRIYSIANLILLIFAFIIPGSVNLSLLPLILLLSYRSWILSKK